MHASTYDRWPQQVRQRTPDRRSRAEAGKLANQIIGDIEAGRYRSVPVFQDHGLNIISCPSCSRVENEAFIDLAINVKAMSASQATRSR